MEYMHLSVFENRKYVIATQSLFRPLNTSCDFKKIHQVKSRYLPFQIAMIQRRIPTPGKWIFYFLSQFSNESNNVLNYNILGLVLHYGFKLQQEAHGP